MKYIFAPKGAIEKLGARPRWFDDEGNPVPDEVLVQHGWYPVIEEPPEYDTATQYVARKPFAEWIVEADVVRATYTVHDRDPAEVAEMLARAIDAEYTRRVVQGRPFEIDGYGPVHPDGSPATQIVLLALKDTARDLKDAGITAPILMFTGTGVDHYLTADQMIQLVNEGKVWVQQMHAAQRALKAMSQIPTDYADDAYWP